MKKTFCNVKPVAAVAVATFAVGAGAGIVPFGDFQCQSGAVIIRCAIKLREER